MTIVSRNMKKPLPINKTRLQLHNQYSSKSVYDKKLDFSNLSLIEQACRLAQELSYCCMKLTPHPTIKINILTKPRPLSYCTNLTSKASNLTIVLPLIYKFINHIA